MCKIEEKKEVAGINVQSTILNFKHWIKIGSCRNNKCKTTASPGKREAWDWGLNCTFNTIFSP